MSNIQNSFNVLENKCQIVSIKLLSHLWVVFQWLFVKHPPLMVLESFVILLLSLMILQYLVCLKCQHTLLT